MTAKVWDARTLAELVDDAIGGLWGSLPDSGKPDEVDVLVVRGADFRAWDARRALDAAPRRIPARALERRRLAAGDLVLEVSGGSPAQPVGRVLVIDDRAVMESRLPLICSNFCRKLRLKPGVDPYFVKRQLDWLYRSGHTDHFQTSTTNIRNLQVDNFLDGTSIMLPEQALQAQLAALLDRIDAKRGGSSTHVAAARRTIGRFRQAVLIAACSGRLTATWRERYPTLASHGPVGDRRHAVVPLIEAPDEWAWCSLADIAELKGGVQKGARLKLGQRTREVPYLRVANVQRGWLDLSEIKTIVVPEYKIAELRLEPGDVLFNEGGDRDKLGRGWIWEGQIDECIHQNHVFRARLKDPDSQPRFYSWYGNTIGAAYFIDQGKQTVNLASLNMSTLKALPVPVPSPEEQREIVEGVERLLKLADELQQRVETAGRKIERSSQSVLAKTFRDGLLAPNGS